jgi:hypothetical protein
MMHEFSVALARSREENHGRPQARERGYVGLDLKLYLPNGKSKHYQFS